MLEIINICWFKINHLGWHSLTIHNLPPMIIIYYREMIYAITQIIYETYPRVNNDERRFHKLVVKHHMFVITRSCVNNLHIYT